MTLPSEEIDSESELAEVSSQVPVVEDATLEIGSSEASEAAEVDELAIRLGLDSSFDRLAPQQVRFEQRVGYISVAVLSIVAVAISIATFLNLQSEWWFLPALIASWLLFIALSVYYSHYWPKVQYKYTGYRLGDSGMEILRGVFWRHKISIPLARVQHVDVSQGPVQRMFDLGTLTVHTAGTKNASVELDGLEHATAVQLRDSLVEQRETLDVT